MRARSSATKATRFRISTRIGKARLIAPLCSPAAGSRDLARRALFLVYTCDVKDLPSIRQRGKGHAADIVVEILCRA